MIKVKYYITKYKIQLFCILVALSILLFTSKNSFLYTFNDWYDANAFFTVGKSIVHGLVPYKDLFEQKGPLLYIIYSLGYLISHKTFYGVFLLEVISFSIYLFYTHKMINYFLDEKYTYIILPITTLIITTSNSFAQGGSCEEFCFPLFSISFYYFLKNFITKNLSKKETIINGVIAGCILLTKYTLLGFWIGFAVLIIIDHIQKKEVKKALFFCMNFLFGLSIPLIITIIYFYIVGGLKDFIWDYFIINITAYGPNRGITLFNIIYGCLFLLKTSGLLFSTVIIMTPILIFSLKNINNNLKANLFSLFFITLFFIIICLKTYIYYILPMSIFLPIGITGLIFLINNKSLLKKHIIIITNIVCIIISAFNANYKEDMFKPKKEIFQFKYANYINKFKEPTLLNMGFLDVGVYTLTGIVPTTKYFETQNINYERFKENIDQLNNYAQNKKTKFIVFCTIKENNPIPKSITKNYDLVYKDKCTYENQIIYARLYQLKDLALKQ